MDALRLIVSMVFQMSFNVSRIYCIFIMYFCDNWWTVILLLNSTIAMIYFSFKKKIWKSNFTNQSVDQNHSFKNLRENIKTSHIDYKLYTFILCLAWFTLGYESYGTLNTWKKIAVHEQILLHNILGSLLGVISKIMVLIVCICVKQKKMPLFVIQLFLAFINFSFLFFDKISFQKDHHSLSSIFVVYFVHMVAFFEGSAFGLVWTMTPELFPVNYRYKIHSVIVSYKTDYDQIHMYL